MEYITVQEAAKKWKISDRLVQKYCAEGRIDGIRKFGKSWEIPSDAVKPQDPRKEKESPVPRHSRPQPEAFPGFMPLMNTPFEPGRCADCIDEMEEGPGKEIALAEYHYFSGRPEKAIQEAELYLTCPDAAYRFSACLIYAYANLSVGQIQHARYALAEIKNTLAADAEKAPHVRAIEAFVVFAASVLLHLPLPEKMPPTQAFLPLLPAGLRAFALYVQAHYLYLKEDYQKSVGIVEATLGMGADRYPIPAIYLHLVAVMDYMSLKQTEQAQKHLLAAWEIARPDDLIEGFGEHHGLLGGMLEAVIKPGWPEDFKRIIAITYRFSAGWRKIHNPATGHDVADDLTTTEFAAAMLAARGWTNQEIAQHMNISAHTVKRYISTVLQKLGIRQRQELKKYMLK
ncbi:MAG TPA: LuxR C-terminal-related transcriptional regulator [Firmicutes bacterium]|nr:LuxR C-terminal-related transcriptional regulator [Bacillota bacterium]